MKSATQRAFRRSLNADESQVRARHHKSNQQLPLRQQEGLPQIRFDASLVAKSHLRKRCNSVGWDSKWGCNCFVFFFGGFRPLERGMISASPNRRSEHVRVIPVIVPELELRNIKG